MRELDDLIIVAEDFTHLRIVIIADDSRAITGFAQFDVRRVKLQMIDAVAEFIHRLQLRSLLIGNLRQCHQLLGRDFAHLVQNGLSPFFCLGRQLGYYLLEGRIVFVSVAQRRQTGYFLVCHLSIPVASGFEAQDSTSTTDFSLVPGAYVQATSGPPPAATTASPVNARPAGAL